MRKEDFKVNLQLFADEPEPTSQPAPVGSTQEPAPAPQPETVSKTEFDALKKQLESVVGLLQATVAKQDDEPATTPQQEPQPTPAPVTNQAVLEFKKSLEDEKKAKEVSATKALEDKVKELEMKDLINETIKAKPHMEAFLLKKKSEGKINSLEDLQMWTSSDFEEAYKAKMLIEDAKKTKGGDPQDLVSGIILSDEANSEMSKQKRREAYNKKMARQLGFEKREF